MAETLEQMEPNSLEVLEAGARVGATGGSRRIKPNQGRSNLIKIFSKQSQTGSEWVRLKLWMVEGWKVDSPEPAPTARMRLWIRDGG